MTNKVDRLAMERYGHAFADLVAHQRVLLFREPVQRKVPTGMSPAEFAEIETACEAGAEGAGYEADLTKRDFAMAAVAFFEEMMRAEHALEGFPPNARDTIEYMKNKLIAAEASLW